MKILAIIPARGDSKGIPGKNIKLLGGKPLLQYTFETAKQVSMFSKIILSSDNQEIIEVAKKIGLEVPFIRPKDLATDDTPTIDVVKHALEFYKNQQMYFDAVCILQVTSPFRTVEFINTSIEKFINSKCDSLISVQKIPNEYNPHWAFILNDKGNLVIATGEDKIVSRRQELPIAFHRDGNIYITKSEIVLNQNSLYGKSIAYIESSSKNYINIDTLEDWERAEKILSTIEFK